jgi:hypothetical protein
MVHIYTTGGNVNCHGETIWYNSLKDDTILNSPVSGELPRNVYSSIFYKENQTTTLTKTQF